MFLLVLEEFSDFDLFLLERFIDNGYGLWSQYGENSFDAYLTAPESHGRLALNVVIFMCNYYITISGGFMQQYCDEVRCNDQLTYMLTLFMLFVQYFQRYTFYYFN